MRTSPAAADLLDRIRDAHARRQRQFQQDMQDIDRAYYAQIQNILRVPRQEVLPIVVALISLLPFVIVAIAVLVDALIR